MTAEHRSVHPNLAGLPWWAAVAVATLATAVGAAFDAGSGDNELTHVFAALYVLGCFAAVLGVRQSGLFTAVIQPPLILFCAVPAAYWVFHGATFTDIKGILINCGYPLIERFPLMLFTSAGVLLIGMARWYFGMVTRPSTPRAESETATGPGPITTTVQRLTGELVRKLKAAFHRDPARPTRPVTAPATPRRQRGTDRPRRPSRTAAASRGSGSTRHAASTRSRDARPRADGMPDWEADRPRRRRPAPTRGEGPPPPPPRRRPRPPQNAARHGQPARDARRDPYRDTGRRDSYRPGERPGPPPPLSPPPPPPPRRRAPNAANGDRNAGTHHPISQVRYRRPDSSYESNGPRKDAADWEYDI